MSEPPRGIFKAPFEAERPEKASQTLLSRIDVCPYSGALYLRHKGGPQTARMAGGEAMHAAIENCIRLLVEADENRMPPEVAKDMAQAVIEERTDLALSVDEQEAVRTALWNWASWTVIDPQAVVGTEAMLELAVAGWTIRGKLDLAEIVDGEGVVTDWKSSLAIPPAEQYARNFQAQFYALLLAEGVPEGEDVPLGKGLSGIHTKQVFPRHRADDGLPYRHAYYDRQQLHDFRRALEAHLAKLDHGLEAGEWAASPGSHCQTCPASSECPIPAHLREIKTIGTPGDAVEVAERILFLDSEAKQAKASLRGYVDENGPVQVGDVAFDLTYTEAERLSDKDGLKVFIAEHGGDPADYFRKAPSTRFGRKKVAA